MLNANALYELAIRHMIRLPAIHMIDDRWDIPFDVAPYRAIRFSWKNIQRLEGAKQGLKSVVEETLSTEFEVENPITHAWGVIEVNQHDCGRAPVV